MSNAAMTGEALFNASATVEIPEQVDMDELRDQLDVIANDLTIDINLEGAD